MDILAGPHNFEGLFEVRIVLWFGSEMGWRVGWDKRLRTVLWKSS